MKLHPLARTLVTARTWPIVIDAGVAACGLAIFFSIVSTGAYWLGKPVPVVPISHSIGALPVYAFYSIVRIFIAYLLSLCFAVSYGYTAAYNPRVEAWMIAVLDILHSRAQLSAARRAGHGGPRARPSDGHRDGRHSAHLHRTGMEPGL